MKLSLQWINQYIELKNDPHDIAERLSISLAEVEGVTVYADQYEGIVVGKITALAPHPNADALQVATVDIQSETLSIVCGAHNIAVGDYVPVATIGTVLPANDHQESLTIEKRAIRGVESEGMLCSPRELGISDDHSGILLLNDEAHVRIGERLATLLKADDVIFEIENKALTHRPDTFSHIGMARELATMYELGLNIPEPSEHPNHTAKSISFDIQDPTLCRRYSGAVIKDITIKASPLWLQLRLQRLGVRPINNIVDITNYVMLETGQPLHAFDQAKLHGDTVIVRTATDGETLTTLDGKERTLTTDMLVIADQNGPIALAGVMGGITSEVSEKTTTIVLESANFEQYNNRKTGRTLGLQTEASVRFSKNQDPELTLPALQQAIAMIVELAGGTVETITDTYPQPRTPQQIITTSTFLIDRIGDPALTNTDGIVATFTRLGITVTKDKDALTCTIPTYRPDLTMQEDLVEEIARFKGYDSITPTLPQRDLTPARVNPHIAWKRRVNTTLTQLGLTEVYNYSFVGKDWYGMCNVQDTLTIPLRNPISPEHAYLKPSLLPSLLGNINTNRKHYDQAAIFELDTVFEDNSDQLPHEIDMLGVAVYAQQDTVYERTKGVAESVIGRLNMPQVVFRPIDTSDNDPILAMLHPLCAAVVMCGNELIGYVGELNPEIQVKLGIQGAVGLAELRANTLYHLTDTGTIYQPVSIHPALTIDISCLLDRDVSLDEVRHTLTQAGSELLVKTIALSAKENVERFGQGKKAVTFRLMFQSSQHSLAKKDVAADVENVKNVLTKNFAAEIRS